MYISFDRDVPFSYGYWYALHVHNICGGTNSHSLCALLQENTRAAFQSVESVVGAFASVRPVRGHAHTHIYIILATTRHLLSCTLATCLQDVTHMSIRCYFLIYSSSGLHDAGINLLCRAQLLQVHGTKNCV